jgi:hypothetical protein
MRVPTHACDDRDKSMTNVTLQASHDIASPTDAAKVGASSNLLRHSVTDQSSDKEADEARSHP